MRITALLAGLALNLLQVLCKKCCLKIETSNIEYSNTVREIELVDHFGDFDGYPDVTYPSGQHYNIMWCHFVGQVTNINNGECFVNAFGCQCDPCNTALYQCSE